MRKRTNEQKERARKQEQKIIDALMGARRIGFTKDADIALHIRIALEGEKMVPLA